LQAARRDIGIVFERYNLLSSLTVRGNVALPLELKGASKAALRARLDVLLDLLELAEIEDAYRSQLSPIEKRRVGVARALAEVGRTFDIFTAPTHEATRSLVRETLRSEMPELLKVRIHKSRQAGDHLAIRITFTAPAANDRLLARQQSQSRHTRPRTIVSSSRRLNTPPQDEESTLAPPVVAM
jgi:ABC-type methionine transport system ATPase subunit